MGLCGKTKTQRFTDYPMWLDPLGPVGYDQSGQPIFDTSGQAAARRARESILSGAGSAAQTAARAFQSAAELAQNLTTSPLYAAGLKNYERMLSGYYMPGGEGFRQLTEGLYSQAARRAADQQQRLQSQFSRAGMQWSTAHQQAAQAAQAAEAARAREAALALAQQERAYQVQAPGQVLSYLMYPATTAAAAASEAMTPWLQYAQTLQPFTGSYMTPQSTVVQTQKPGILDYVAGGVEVLTGLDKVFGK